MPLLKRKDKSPEPEVKSEKKSNKIKISAEKGLGGLSNLKRSDPVNHLILKPRQRRYNTKMKMYALHKYLTIDPKTGGRKYDNKNIVRLVNERFGSMVRANTLVCWAIKGGWKEILQGLMDDAVHKTLGTMERRAHREAIIKVKLEEEMLFDPQSVMDTLYAPKHNKAIVASTIFRRAAEQNKIAHKSLKFAAKQGMLVSSKECSERLAVSAGEASSIFQATAKTMQTFIGLVEHTSPSIAINNNVTNNTANVHQQQVCLDLSTINYETIMLKMGDEVMKSKNPNKLQNCGGEEEGELIVPIDNEFIRSTETDKT